MEPEASEFVAQNHNIRSNAEPLQSGSHPHSMFYFDSLQYVFTTVMFKSRAFYLLIYKKVLII